jgi:hypothetical protein
MEDFDEEAETYARIWNNFSRKIRASERRRATAMRTSGKFYITSQRLSSFGWWGATTNRQTDR